MFEHVAFSHEVRRKVESKAEKEEKRKPQLVSSGWLQENKKTGKQENRKK